MLVRKISQSLLQTALIVLGGASMMLMFSTPSRAQTQTVPSTETQLENSDSTIDQDPVEKNEATERQESSSSEGLSENSDTAEGQDLVEKNEASDMLKPASEEEISEENDKKTDYQPVNHLNREVEVQEKTVQ